MRWPRRRRSRGRHRIRLCADTGNLRLLWAGQLVNTAGLMMLVPVMPFYVQQMGVLSAVEAQTWAGAAIAAPALALVVATPLWGRLGDRVGRKWMVVRALLGLAAAMVVMAVASTPLALVAGRLLQGILGGVVEAAAGFASTSGRGGARGATLGKSFSATAAGALLGPLAGGALVGTGNLRALMLVIALIAAALALASAVALTEPPRDRGHSTPDMLARDPAAGARRGRVLPLAAAAVAVYFGVYGLIPVYAQYTQSMVSSPASAGMWVGVAQSVTWAATLLASPWWGRRNDTTGGPLRNFVLAAAGCGLAIARRPCRSDWSPSSGCVSCKGRASPRWPNRCSSTPAAPCTWTGPVARSAESIVSCSPDNAPARSWPVPWSVCSRCRWWWRYSVARACSPRRWAPGQPAATPPRAPTATSRHPRRPPSRAKRA